MIPYCLPTTIERHVTHRHTVLFVRIPLYDTSLTPPSMEERNSMLVPLRPAYGDDRSSSNPQLALALPPTAAIANITPRIKLPPGWGVEEVLRSDGSHIDRYYYEPGTGRKFRSSREVERHLNGEKNSQYKLRPRRKLTLHNRNSGCRGMIVSGGKMLKLGNKIHRNKLAMVVSRSPKASPYFKLPKGWIVEKVPRKYDSEAIDKYYYEPKTGRKFRSLVSVERYLAELDEDDIPLAMALAKIKENKLMSKIFQLENHIENSIPRTKNIYGDMKVSSIVGPPMKVKWVLASTHGDAWNPIISDISVPDSVKQQWTKRFMRIMNDGSLDSQNSSA